MKKKLGLEHKEGITICYSRESANDQKQDLERQKEELKKYCTEQKYTNIVEIKETGSG